ncbi:MAG: SDR family oxidoreductase [Levilactobacillus sp.]|jgi:NAD(P)-dependent dehydrogenase (short-subunit alcohol dehydrogenase family)|uniref:SDR family oxidoreductase n=1 Tax=Levilactobacillus sp. TaxID=2767919 RepID=UPI00258A0CD2|nr:SDR family oxidoreductase [Levilactobacillus sp.]MCI1553321.1 SDR family oxidoreductase [Levilactobacillus sp.]MCI1598512.1 SDR family oxidoreductase [Levilactobacillus sp.]MCI1605238.1 SDR family oxidoreductase [Levilactobacillus sp.]
MKLTQQRILIVGGTSGFGETVAGQALQAGASVHVIGHSQAHVDAALTRLQLSGTDATGTALDAQDPHQLAVFFACQPKFDHVLSFLGGAMGGGFLDNDVATIRQAIEDKFFANLQLAKAAVGHLNEHGSLIFTSGAGGHPDDASGAIIGNQAINTMVAGLAVELAPDFRVNAVAPTWTPTGLWRQLSAEQVAQQAQDFAQGVPLKRVATQAEVASAYLYLMENDFVTGQVLHVDGGVDLGVR